MARYCDQLTRSERLALSLSGCETPTTWRRVEPVDAVHNRSARRKSGLAPAVMLSVLAVFGVLALELFSIKLGQPGAIFFPSGKSEAQAFAAVVAAGGLPVRATRSVFGEGVVWIAAAEDPSFFSNVIDAGALAVINPFAFGGCMLADPQ